MARDMLSKSAGGDEQMAAAASPAPIRRIGEKPELVTLLDLVRAVGRAAEYFVVVDDHIRAKPQCFSAVLPGTPLPIDE